MRGVLRTDDGIVARIARGQFADHAGAHRVMVAAGDQRRPRRRAERGGVELRVAQSRLGDAVQRRRRDDTAEGARHAVALVVGHDEQHVGRALGRHDARRPPGLGIRGAFLDHAAELQRRRRDLFSVDRGRGARRPQLARDLLRRDRCDGQQRDERKASLDDSLHCASPLVLESRRTACGVTSVISPGLLDFSSRGRTSAGAQKKLDEGHRADELGALSFEAEQRARALWVHEVDLREFDPVRKTLAANGVLEHGDVRTGYGSGYPQNV